MKDETHARPPLRLIGWTAIIAALAAMFLVNPSYAQEAPDASPEAPDASPEAPAETGTRVFLEIEAPDGEPVGKGNTFLVHVKVSDVENLSAFSFELGFDPDRIRPVPLGGDDAEAVTPTPFGGTPVPDSDDDLVQNLIVQGEIGQFVADGPRNSLCIGPSIQSPSAGVVTAGCASVGPPVCLGGAPGVSGSGTLGTVVFESRGGEMTDITLASPVLTSADVEPPCDPEDFQIIRIPHEQGGPVTVLLSGGGSSSVLLIVIIAVVAVAVLGAGLGGFLLYHRRDASSAASD